MLLELAVHDLGVIAELHIVIADGMTALTGETGAGKTLVVEAIELLVGARADPMLVRPGAEEATVEGRFELDGEEIVLARTVPAEGRSRASVNGRMMPATALAELGVRLVDLHGQHAHQSLLGAAAQRQALDAYGGVDLRPLGTATTALAEIDGSLAELGGDTKARAREIELLRHQVAEIDGAAISGPGEDAALEVDEDRLAGAAGHREASLAAQSSIAADGSGALDRLGAAVGAVVGHAPLGEVEQRLRAIAADAADVAADLRLVAEAMEDDPERLAEVRSRRSLLRDLQRKYGDSLEEVTAFGGQARSRLVQLESFEARAAELEQDRADALETLGRAEAAVGNARRAAAPRLARAVEANLRRLALEKARFEVGVGESPRGDDVEFLLGANPGEPALPLSRVASGGELARAMLATRLVTSQGPPTLVFDEVDAGVGGEAALAVGRALSDLARSQQVLVVTHLPQVAAFADNQVSVHKTVRRGRTVAEVEPLGSDARVVELSRMLSGQPESTAARDHAEELLAVAARARGL